RAATRSAHSASDETSRIASGPEVGTTAGRTRPLVLRASPRSAVTGSVGSWEFIATTTPTTTATSMTASWGTTASLNMTTNLAPGVVMGTITTTVATTATT